MRLVIPLPFGEIEINTRKSRRARPLFWYSLLSAALHTLAIGFLGFLAMRQLLPMMAAKQQPREIVTISSAVRIERRPHAARANHPLAHPRPIPRHVPVRVAAYVRPQPQPATPAPLRRELSKPAKIAYASTSRLTPAQLQAQTRMFEQTIAQARAASDPVAGAAEPTADPAATKRYTMNLQGDEGRPQPEGVLYPTKRWVDGPYVYYYVTYTAIYADGSTESGSVPWPIRFLLADDPFARNLHRMPLPGPLPDFVLPDGLAMTPLVKNCFDHHYEYCPIAHE